MTIKLHSAVSDSDILQGYGRPIVLMFYKMIDNDDNIENKTHIFGDIFKNKEVQLNTIDYSRSNFWLDEDGIACALHVNTTNEVTTGNPGGTNVVPMSDVSYAFDYDPTTYSYSDGTKSSTSNYHWYVQKTFDSILVNKVQYHIYLDVDVISSYVMVGITLETYDGSSWSSVHDIVSYQSISSDTTYDIYETYSLNSTIQGIRIHFTLQQYYHYHIKVYSFFFGDYVDSNIMLNTLDAQNINSVVPYIDKTLNTGTSITMSLSDNDGATWKISDNTEFENLVDTTELSDNTDIRLKFTLKPNSAGDTTPKLYGYSVVITDK